MTDDRIRGLVIVGHEVTDAERHRVADFLGYDGLATNDQMRVFLAAHGRTGLDALAIPLLTARGASRVPIRT